MLTKTSLIYVLLRLSFVFFITVGIFGCTTNTTYNRGRLDNSDILSERTIKPATKINFEKPPSLLAIANGELSAPSSEELNRQLKEAGTNWFYGPGLGRSVLNIGTVVLMPVYGLYLLANAGLQLAGIEPLYLTDALPEGPRKGVNEVYEGITSTPGVLTSILAEHEYYSEKSVKEAADEK